jgi:hypothetical protein
VFIIRNSINQGQAIWHLMTEIDNLITEETTTDERNKFKRVLSRIWRSEVEQWEIRNGKPWTKKGE